MLTVTLVFGVPLLIAGAMIDPTGLHLGGLLTYAAIMLVLMPICGCGVDPVKPDTRRVEIAA
jgi:hypothetical protein